MNLVEQTKTRAPTIAAIAIPPILGYVLMGWAGGDNNTYMVCMLIGIASIIAAFSRLGKQHAELFNSKEIIQLYTYIIIVPIIAPVLMFTNYGMTPEQAHVLEGCLNAFAMLWPYLVSEMTSFKLIRKLTATMEH